MLLSHAQSHCPPSRSPIFMPTSNRPQFSLTEQQAGFRGGSRQCHLQKSRSSSSSCCWVAVDAVAAAAAAAWSELGVSVAKLVLLGHAAMYTIDRHAARPNHYVDLSLFCSRVALKNCGFLQAACHVVWPESHCSNAGTVQSFACADWHGCRSWAHGVNGICLHHVQAVGRYRGIWHTIFGTLDEVQGLLLLSSVMLSCLSSC